MPAELQRTLADVEHQSDAAVVVRRAVVEREVARTHELARARLEVGPGDAPGHDVLPSRRGPEVDCSWHGPRCQPGARRQSWTRSAPRGSVPAGERRSGTRSRFAYSVSVMVSGGPGSWRGALANRQLYAMFRLYILD